MSYSTFNLTDEVTCIKFNTPRRVISNAIFGGGLRDISAIVNYTLGKNEHPEMREMNDFCTTLAKKNLCDPTSTLVMLTAVPQKYRGCYKNKNDFSIVTAGLQNAISLTPDFVYDETEDPDGRYVYHPGTINCFHIFEESLSDIALLEAYGMTKLCIGKTMLSWSAHLCTHVELVGTPTVCITVISRKADRSIQFAGLGTKIGVEVAERTSSAFMRALSHKYPDFTQHIATCV
jgi:adenosylcobinamide amidohydrolase